MAHLLSGLSVFSFSAWTALMGLLNFFIPKSALVQYLRTEVTAHKQELRALDESQAATVAKLSGADQVLMFFSKLPLTQAKAAKRRYWKNENPAAFAKLYRKLGYTAEEAESIMCDAERMPGYFRKKVHACLKAA